MAWRLRCNTEGINTNLADRAVFDLKLYFYLNVHGHSAIFSKTTKQKKG